jgi:Domain of unknown function (DUF4349)
MSRLDAIAELHETRPVAPRELRERVRAIAAVPAPPRRLTWRRAALVLVPAVLAVAVGAVAIGRDGQPTAQHGAARGVGADHALAPGTQQKTFGATAAAPAPSRTRAQDYDATLRLRVHDGAAISDATKRAVRIAGSLGGFASVVSVDVGSGSGTALLRLRVPVTKVQIAVQRLSELGTITGESVSIRDVQPTLDATDRTIGRLQRQLRALRAQPTPPAARIAALTARIERLQRAQADTLRRTRLATIELRLTTRAPAAPAKPKGHGPLHGAVVALTWLGIGALYALIVGGPIVALLAAAWLGWRAYRRTAERRLLERS